MGASTMLCKALTAPLESPTATVFWLASFGTAVGSSPTTAASAAPPLAPTAAAKAAKLRESLAEALTSNAEECGAFLNTMKITSAQLDAREEELKECHQMVAALKGQLAAKNREITALRGGITSAHEEVRRHVAARDTMHVEHAKLRAQLQAHTASRLGAPTDHHEEPRKQVPLAASPNL